MLNAGSKSKINKNPNIISRPAWSKDNSTVKNLKDENRVLLSNQGSILIPARGIPQKFPSKRRLF
jgi:hypothetical protein